jgi:hypothetical protein
MSEEATEYQYEYPMPMARPRSPMDYLMDQLTQLTTLDANWEQLLASGINYLIVLPIKTEIPQFEDQLKNRWIIVASDVPSGKQIKFKAIPDIPTKYGPAKGLGVVLGLREIAKGPGGLRFAIPTFSPHTVELAAQGKAMNPLSEYETGLITALYSVGWGLPQALRALATERKNVKDLERHQIWLMTHEQDILNRGLELFKLTKSKGETISRLNLKQIAMILLGIAIIGMFIYFIWQAFS